MRAAGNRRRGLTSTGTAAGRIGRTTLAFTVGHSVALAMSALARLDIPAQPVETFIAFSVLVGAVHANRPLFPGHEAVVAEVFGLGHGLAFSLTLAEMHLLVLLDRLGLANPVARAADSAGTHTSQLLLVQVTCAVLATLWTLAPPGRGNPRRSWRFAHRS
ncbi:HupE/UreJ family protein [Streptomyces sp. NPDC058464]|uniref:HupE/UreJ family protein n=1 Tax=Streptomyces sp. NPDC058464 TaxID=3346511 RepID=UPI0036463C21